MPILSWYDDKNDTCLFDYLPLLKELSAVDDVRPFLMASVKDNILDIPKAMALVRAYKEQINQNLSKSSKYLCVASNNGIGATVVTNESE